MIEFKGELSEACKNFVVNNESNMARFSSMIASIPFAIIDIVWSFYDNLIYLIVLPLLVMCVFLAGIKPGKKSYGFLMTKRVEIEDGYLGSEGDKFTETRRIDQIKNVIDYGEWYKINFTFPNKSQRFICQKDLITQGTIEEFEAMFEGKIIRKKIK